MRAGAPDVGHAGASAAGLGLAVHDGGVHLVGAGVGEYAALAGVEVGAVLEKHQHRLHHVHGGLPGGKQFASAAEDVLERFESLGDGVDVLNVSRAAVDADGPFFDLILCAVRDFPNAR